MQILIARVYAKVYGGGTASKEEEKCRRRTFFRARRLPASPCISMGQRCASPKKRKTFIWSSLRRTEEADPLATWSSPREGWAKWRRGSDSPKVRVSELLGFWVWVIQGYNEVGGVGVIEFLFISNVVEILNPWVRFEAWALSHETLFEFDLRYYYVYNCFLVNSSLSFLVEDEGWVKRVS